MSGHANLNLGNLITTPQRRDATHIAIAPVVAGERLKPGAHVMIRTDGVAVKSNDGIGIIDPFLRGDVGVGEHCWVFIYPNTVTDLRHEWSHPMLPDPAAWERFSRTSETRLREIAGDLGLTYERLIEGTREWISTGRLLSEGPLLEGASVPDDFWEHYGKATGTVVPEDKIQSSFFSCSC